LTFTRTCTLTPGVGAAPLLVAAELKKVRVTVTWAAENRPGSVDMETLFTR